MGYPPEYLRWTLDSCTAHICFVEGWIFQEATEEENGEMKNKKQHKTEKEFFSSGLPQKCDCTIKNLDIHAVFTIFFKLQCITKKKKKPNRAEHRANKLNT